MPFALKQRVLPFLYVLLRTWQIQANSTIASLHHFSTSLHFVNYQCPHTTTCSNEFCGWTLCLFWTCASLNAMYFALQRNAQRTSFQCHSVPLHSCSTEKKFARLLCAHQRNITYQLFLMLVLWSLNKRGLLQVTKYHTADASGVVEQQAADRLWEQEAILDSFFKLFNRQV